VGQRKASRRLDLNQPQTTKTEDDMIKRLVLLLFTAATLAVGVTACHTVHGAGEDISTAGSKIQQNTPP
jgi:predicted small secreted protein